MTDLSNRESTLFDLAKQYRASQVRSANENDIRGDIRETVEKLGLDGKSFQDSIRMELELTEGGRMDYVNGLNEMSGILKGRTVDLLGEDEARRKEERIKRREEREAKAKAGANPPAPDSPRGDPAKGGAGGVDGKKKAKDAKPKAVEPKVTGRKPGRPRKTVPVGQEGQPGDLKVGELVQAQDKPADAAAANAAQEQVEGGAIVDGALERINGASGNPVKEGDAMIRRISEQKNAELAARGGVTGASIANGGPPDIESEMQGVDASEPVDEDGDNGEESRPAHGLGALSDERRLSQSEQSRRILEDNGLNKPI